MHPAHVGKRNAASPCASFEAYGHNMGILGVEYSAVELQSNTGCYYAPAPRAEALSDDTRLTSVCLTSVYAYIGPTSRTEWPRKTKISIEVAHVTRDSDITFKVKRSKVNLQGAVAYYGGLPHSLFRMQWKGDDRCGPQGRKSPQKGPQAEPRRGMGRKPSHSVILCLCKPCFCTSCACFCLLCRNIPRKEVCCGVKSRVSS